MTKTCGQHVGVGKNNSVDTNISEKNRDDNRDRREGLHSSDQGYVLKVSRRERLHFITLGVSK